MIIKTYKLQNGEDLYQLAQIFSIRLAVEYGVPSEIKKVQNGYRVVDDENKIVEFLH